MRVQIALMRMSMRQLLSSQRYVLASIALLAIPAVTLPTGGALPDDYGVASLLVSPITAFLAVQTTNAGSQGFRSVLLVAAGRRGRTIAAQAMLTMTFAVTGAAFLTVCPLILASRAFDRGQVSTGFLCIVAAALTGSGIGLIASRYVFRKSGWSVSFALLALFASVLTPTLSPLREAIDVLQQHPASSGRAFAAASLATGWLLMAAVAIGLVARRRDNL